MKTLKVILVLLLVFGAGAVGGVVATRIAVRHFIANAVANPDIVQVRIERELTRKLSLDRRQRVEVNAVLKQTHESLKALREQFQPQFTNIVENARNQISTILTPEQQEKFLELQAQNRRFFQR
ncbi:MAG TPA: hypothetical protein VH255_10900 [Verrucomicrobiae bacterium]|jgi:Spy/CpxP family protein refolding chaperone|nr:hypothetical protein [Verrucomicrobiae bacterium]